MIGDVLMKHIVMTILGLIIVILLGITGYLGYISNQYVVMNKQLNSDLQVANQNLKTARINGLIKAYDMGENKGLYVIAATVRKETFDNGAQPRYSAYVVPCRVNKEGMLIMDGDTGAWKVAFYKNKFNQLMIENQNLFTFSKVTTDNQKALYETLKENAD